MILPISESKRKLSTPHIQKATWAISDQVLSSGTNAIIGFLIARHASSTLFGIFTLVYTAYLIIFGLSQAIVAWPLMVQFGSRPRNEIREQIPAVLGLAFIVAIISTSVFGIVAINVSVLANTLSLIMVLAIPFLVIQATWRSQFFAEGDPKSAFICDAIWAVIQAILYVAIYCSSGTLTPDWILFGWALGGSLAGGIFCAVKQSYPARGKVYALLKTTERCVGDLAPNIQSLSPAFTLCPIYWRGF